MKTSQNLNKVLSKLPKTELKSEKVELALDGELKEQGQKAQAIFNDGRKDSLQIVTDASSKMEDAKKQLETLAKKIDSTYGEALAMAKELGVDLDGTTVGKNYKTAYNEVTDYVISSTTAIDKLRKFSI